MAYLVGAALGIATGAAVNAVQRNNAQLRELRRHAHWSSPLSRLGRCGIFSLRAWSAVSDVQSAADRAGAGTWRVANDVRCDGLRAGIDQVLVHTAGRVAVIQTMMGADFPAAVGHADQGAHAATSAAGEYASVQAYVCRVDTADEPRPLPGPSGKDVTVTGLHWLEGLLRRDLEQQPPASVHPDQILDQEGLPPSRLHLSMADAWWRSSKKLSTECQALLSLPVDQWWTAADLYLDDPMTDTVDLVLAGPGGVFVFEFTRVATADAAFRAVRQAHRLGDYLPSSFIVPAVVCAEVSDAAQWPATVNDHAHPVAALQPGQVLEYVRQGSGRGVGPYEIGTLNVPYPGWYRQVWAGTDRRYHRVGWVEDE